MGNKIVSPQKLCVELLHKQFVKEHWRQRADRPTDFRLLLMNDLPRRFLLFATVSSPDIEPKIISASFRQELRAG